MWGYYRHLSSLEKTREIILPNVFQNSFSSLREATSSVKLELELELFLEKSYAYQTGSLVALYGFSLRLTFLKHF
jgi:hypothetical protein